MTWGRGAGTRSLFRLSVSAPLFISLATCLFRQDSRINGIPKLSCLSCYPVKKRIRHRIYELEHLATPLEKEYLYPNSPRRHLGRPGYDGGPVLCQWHTPTLAFSPSGQGLQTPDRAIPAGLQPAPSVDTGLSPWPPAAGKVPFTAGFSRAPRSSGFIQSLPPKWSRTLRWCDRGRTEEMCACRGGKGSSFALRRGL